MVKCSYCEKEFQKEHQLHLHWKKQHGEQINSHEKEKAKKAERKEKEKIEKKRRKRKKYGGYGLAAAITLTLILLIGSQLTTNKTQPNKTQFNLKNQPNLGNPNASVTIVEFGDYRCPFCKKFDNQVFPKIKKKLIDTGKAKYYFLNYPFLGEGSTEAAIAAECVYQQNKTQYWSYHHAIYDNQGSERVKWVTVDLLINLARQNTENLDYQELRQCIIKRKTFNKVKQDKKEGLQANIKGTPSIFINGDPLKKLNYRNIEKAVQRELKAENQK